MRILMVTMQFPLAPGESYLTTELAAALAAAGHDLVVVHQDWQAPTGQPSELVSGERPFPVLRVGPRAFGPRGSVLWRAAKFLRSDRHLTREVQRHFDLGTFDALIGWMPGLAMASLARAARHAGIARRLMFIWDFFPQHYHEIGRLPGGPVLALAQRAEQRVVANFNAFLCTLPGNAAYLRRHFALDAQAHVGVTPIWGNALQAPHVDRAGTRARYGLPIDQPVAVFGGQMVAGRGFEQMLGAARVAHDQNLLLQFLFVGQGPLAAQWQAQAADLPNVHWQPAIVRDEYLRLIAACDVGMAATVPGVTSFSFPSKIIDYLRVGLPVVVAIEHGSELVRLVESWQIGRCVNFGDAAGFAAAAQDLVESGADFRDAARRCLDAVFAVRHTVAAMETAFGATRAAINQPSTSAAPSA